MIGGSSQVQPRIVRAGDENRLQGELALPYNANPYLAGFGFPNRVAGVALPGAGDYDIVFDSASPSGAGPFTFRFWVADTTAPSLRLISARGGVLRISARDTGSGIDHARTRLFVDGGRRAASFDAARGLMRASIRNLRRGRHTLKLLVSDYQESKNMENVHRILPNTRRLNTTFVVR